MAPGQENTQLTHEGDVFRLRGLDTGTLYVEHRAGPIKLLTASICPSPDATPPEPGVSKPENNNHEAMILDVCTGFVNDGPCAVDLFFFNTGTGTADPHPDRATGIETYVGRVPPGENWYEFASHGHTFVGRTAAVSELGPKGSLAGVHRVDIITAAECPLPKAGATTVVEDEAPFLPVLVAEPYTAAMPLGGAGLRRQLLAAEAASANTTIKVEARANATFIAVSKSKAAGSNLTAGGGGSGKSPRRPLWGSIASAVVGAGGSVLY